MLLGSALCFWVLPCASGFCLLLLGSACLCCVNARCPNVRNILPVGFPFMWFNLPILLSGSLLLPGLGSRLHLVFDLVFPGLDFLVLFPSLPFFGCSLVSLSLWLVLLPSSCSLLWAGAAGGCLLQLVSLFAWSLFLVSACPVLLGGRGMEKNNNYFTSSDPRHDIYTFCYWQIFWHSI